MQPEDEESGEAAARHIIFFHPRDWSVVRRVNIVNAIVGAHQLVERLCSHEEPTMIEYSETKAVILLSGRYRLVLFGARDEPDVQLENLVNLLHDVFCLQHGSLEQGWRAGTPQPRPTCGSVAGLTVLAAGPASQ